MRIFNIKNKINLIKSFIVGVLWSLWIYLWFFHRSFILGPRFFNPWEYGFPFNYIISVFTLYSILYLPQYSDNTKLSLMYLLKICIYELINILVLYVVYLQNELIPIIILILFLNFIIVSRAKYTQLRFWEKYKSTIIFRVKNETKIKENHIKLFIFIFLGVILLNLSGIFFDGDGDLIYILFSMTQIVFSVGYFLCVSENRKWIDRTYDFLAILVLNFINLTLKYVLWSYVNLYMPDDWVFWIVAFSLELFQVYIYYSFFSRTYLADFSINLHKIPDPLKKSSKELTVQEQSYCPKCGNEIELLDSSIEKENSTIYCPFCGEKIIKYELLDISEAELLIKHQKVMQQLDNKSEPRSYLP
ncbi:zinc ribbon domain-containing protein [Promethearchaeum syntrophicum]|uniref:Zinc ribbon domain-containing protein n=1 Tax=Promethearchaeum syntrophicum TaxID=2594042 RepID=A0A5B9DEW1_9ARCH|nr:zinc ribbon domain-containing protein [Candidatus Prometheoarchaeum syntrophicum]QEE17808.1 hypothetical protein DSAG12_03646 [Candidatus Prometheoarchaeum syntrophicum]